MDPLSRCQTVFLLHISPVMEAIAVALLCLVTFLGASLEEEMVRLGIGF